MFLGIPLEEDTLNHIAQFRSQWEDMPGIRWIPDKQLHITVYFLGNVPAERLPNLIEFLPRSIEQVRVI